MVINNYNNKKYVEITNNEIIFYKWYGKRRLKRNKIRAAFMNDEYKITILYGKSIRKFNVCNVNKNEKVILEELIKLMNKEDLIFAVNRYNVCEEGFFGILIIQNIILNLGKNNHIWSYIGLFLLIGLLAILAYLIPNYSIFLYDYNNKYIRLEAVNRNKKKEFHINRDKFRFKYNVNMYSYEFESNKVKKVVFPTNIIYPINYKEKLAELNENTMYCCIK